jgi:antirestriction protein ArdC
VSEREIVSNVEALIAATGADFRIGGERAFYVSAGDFIQVPPQPAFFQQINDYRTCFHELGHCAGHPSRLAPDQSGGFGSKTYAREELVAEMASAFVCASIGITPTVRHADFSAPGSTYCARTTAPSFAIAEKVVGLTDRLTRAATMHLGPGRSLRNAALAFVGHIPRAPEAIARSLAELDNR